MGVPVATVSSEGESLPQTAELLSLVIHFELNRIPEATLTLLDGSVAAQEFALSNSKLLEPGREISIALRHEGESSDETVFEGLVVRHAVEVRPRGSVLRVELKDPAFKLTRRRRSASHRDQSDQQAVRSIVESAGLEVGEIAQTKPTHEELVQYHASDWDFIVSRADVQGLVVRVAVGRVSLLPMIPEGQAAARYEYGKDDIQDLELELDGGSQFAGITSAAWDRNQQTSTTPTPAEEPGVTSGDVDPSTVAARLGGDDLALRHGGSLDPDELQAWADARLARSRLAFLRGHMVVEGRPDLLPGDPIELAGIGTRFDGRALVSSVRHSIDQEGWRTELGLGLRPEWFARLPDIADVAAAGLLPPALRLQLATVAAYEEDPMGEHRIRVKLPALEEDPGVVWARCVQPDAGKERGQVWWPQPDDEVVVGFVDDDPRQAVVLGSLYSKAQPPPESGGPPSEDNPQRSFVTPAGIRVVLDDETRAVTLETPDKRTISMDDDAKSITISDSNGNTVVLDDDGIRIESSKDLVLSADGDVAISGSSVDIQ